MADYISLLHLYCQKSGMQNPIWSMDQVEPTDHPEFSAFRYIYKCTLEIDGAKFNGSVEKSKNEAKKSVASMAWNHFKSLGNPFFTESSKEKLVNYSNQLHQLSIQIPLPHYNIKGFNNDSLGPFKGECYVAGKSFIDNVQFSRKVQAKENVARKAYTELLEDQKIVYCLKNKQGYKIDPRVLHEQFIRHFQGDSLGIEVNQNNGNLSNKGDKGEPTHFIYPPENNNGSSVPTPNFDEPIVDYRSESFSTYQNTPVTGDYGSKFQVSSNSAYYNGPNMWYTQPAFDTSYASPFGYTPGVVKPEQPDLVVVFDRKNEGQNDMGKQDHKDYSDWNSRSERTQNFRSGNNYDFRGRSPPVRENRSLSRSPPRVSHRHRRRRTRSRSDSRSGSRSRRRHRRDREQSRERFERRLRRDESPQKLSIPSNMGKYGTYIYEMAIANPELGRPSFSIRPSPFIVHEVIAQLSIGSKLFLSATSHKKEIDAIEDVSKIAHEELTRMLAINKKMIQYKNQTNHSQSRGRNNTQSTDNTWTSNNRIESDAFRSINDEADDSIRILNNDSRDRRNSIAGKQTRKTLPNYDRTEIDLLNGDENQSDTEFIRLDAPPRLALTEKYKRVQDPGKKIQMNSMREKRDRIMNDRSNNFSLTAIGKVKGEYSEED